MNIKNNDLKAKNHLKIAMIGQKRIPSREGGIEVAVEEMAARMVHQGNEVVCYNRRKHHIWAEEYDTNKKSIYKGIILEPVFTIDKKAIAPVSASIVAAIRAALGKFDIVHFHAEGPSAMLWIPKLFGKHCIVTIHGLDWAREKWKGGFGSRYIKFGEKVAVKRADQIIVLSKEVQKYFQETYGRNTTFISNGINRPNIHTAKEIVGKYGLTKDDYILFVGRIVPEKGLRYLISAFKKIDTNKKLVIAGGVSDTSKFSAELEEQAHHDNRIIFTGFVKGNLLEELYSNAYVYVLPSDLEGMPMSLLEAMSYGNCCLVSDIAECTEVVENKAISFKKGDIEDLKEKL